MSADSEDSGCGCLILLIIGLITYVAVHGTSNKVDDIQKQLDRIEQNQRRTACNLVERVI